MIKVNYKKNYLKNGLVTRQTITIDYRIFNELNDKIRCEKILDFPRKKEYLTDAFNVNFLNELKQNECITLTTLKFISLFLKSNRIKLNRNTLIKVSDES